jgi:alpha-N-arabinofuranosidase
MGRCNVPRATVSVDLRRVVGTADPMIFGQYLEHVEPVDACIYGAILDEGSPLADPAGIRQDVVAAVRELRAPVVRWPGGCFADIYHWEDGVGPRERRPARRNWHWGGLETNRFGTDEFLGWCEATGAVPYVNFNLGTGTLDEAVRWLDYCNGREPTREVDRRRAHGRDDPYGVPLWGIGNETWGDWEAGRMGAHEYAATLRNWAQFLRKVDPTARFLGVGSMEAKDAAWDLAVLQTAGHLIDYLTVHMYGHTIQSVDADDEYYPTVTFPVFFEERLRQLAALIDGATGRVQRETPLRISLDEWNIRHLVQDEESGKPVLKRSSPRTLQDAVFAAGVFHAMLRLAPRVGMGCYVFLLNGNGVLLVRPEGVVKTPLFHLFRAYRERLPPVVLDADVVSEEFVTAVRQGVSHETATRSVAYVDAVVTRDAASNKLGLAVINRHRREEATLRVVPEGFGCGPAAAVWELFHPDVRAANTIGWPDQVRPGRRTITWTGEVSVPPHSVSIFELDIGR